jgi:hypothetical protein
MLLKTTFLFRTKDKPVAAACVGASTHSAHSGHSSLRLGQFGVYRTRSIHDPQLGNPIAVFFAKDRIESVLDVIAGGPQVMGAVRIEVEADLND